MRKLLLGLIGLLFAIPVFAACPSGQVEQTYNWNQLWNAENISKLGGNLNVADNNDGSFTLTVQQNAQYNSAQFRTGGNFIIGHKYVFAMDLTLLNDTDTLNHTTQFRQYNGTGATFGAKNFNFSAINETTHQMGLPFSATSAMSGIGFVIVTQFSYPEIGTSVRINNIQVYDLTAMFGAGNEPTTPEEAEQAISNRAQMLGIDRYVYNSGSQIAACITPIKIATTAYNAARFNPVVTELNTTIATIRDVVTNTINQTKAIADLQATKQTRPDENCPAGKKCLLVEDDAGQPHWYEIIESASRLPDGFTELQYIESTGTQYIDTGFIPTVRSKAVVEAQYTTLNGSNNTFLFATTVSAQARFGWGIYDERFIYNFGGWTYSSVVQDTNRHVFTIDAISKKVSIDSTTITPETNPTFSDASTSIYLFARQTSTNVAGGYAFAKIYSAKFYENDTLVHDFIPVKYVSGNTTTYGMYDLAAPNPATAFYTNKGTGTFIAGPEI